MSDAQRIRIGSPCLLRVAAILVIVAALATSLGCPAKPKAEGKAPMGPAPAPGAIQGPAAAPGGATDNAQAPEEATPPPSGVATPLPDDSRKVIKTAELTIKVSSVAPAESQVKALAEKSGGFVDSVKTSTQTDIYRTSVVTIRVPASRFREVLDGVRGLGQVLEASESGEDVTTEYVDTESRIHNLQREEATLLDLYRRTGSMQDILQVEKELSRVRGEIEQAQGRLRHMADQVAMSTITVHLTEQSPAAVAAPGHWSAKYHVISAYRALIVFIHCILTAVIWLVVLGIPMVVVVWVPILLGRLIGRLRRRPPPTTGLQ